MANGARGGKGCPGIRPHEAVLRRRLSISGEGAKQQASKQQKGWYVDLDISGRAWSAWVEVAVQVLMVRVGTRAGLECHCWSQWSASWLPYWRASVWARQQRERNDCGGKKDDFWRHEGARVQASGAIQNQRALVVLMGSLARCRHIGSLASGS